MEHKFEPFEKVLVRDYENYDWRCNLYSHLGKDEKSPHECVWGMWKYCIPYEGNEHLLGTTDSPTPKHEYRWGDKVEVNPLGMWVRALYYKTEDDNPHKHRVVGYNGAYGNLYHHVFSDDKIRPLKEDQ